MTKLLHTADLHLGGDRPERWAALDALLEAARERSVDLLLVAGDLLDRGEDAAALRPRLRERFDRLDAPVVLLPGNHDREAYGPGQDWGRHVSVLRQEPVTSVRVGSLRILGVPYPADPLPFSGLRRRLEAELSGGDGPALLVLHGTLVDTADARIQRESREDEPDDRYFPIRAGELAGLPVSYVALGHYHQFDLRRVEGVPVAYSGAPSPIGAHALGPRVAVLVEVGGEGPEGSAPGRPGMAPTRMERVRLPVPYRRRVRRWLTPFEEERELEALAGELREAADPECSLRVELEGVLAEMDERTLRERTGGIREELARGYAGVEFDLRSVGLDPGRAGLFRRFRERLEEEVGDREALRRRALEIAARALTAGGSGGR